MTPFELYICPLYEKWRYRHTTFGFAFIRVVPPPPLNKWNQSLHVYNYLTILLCKNFALWFTFIKGSSHAMNVKCTFWRWLKSKCNDVQNFDSWKSDFAETQLWGSWYRPRWNNWIPPLPDYFCLTILLSDIFTFWKVTLRVYSFGVPVCKVVISPWDKWIPSFVERIHAYFQIYLGSPPSHQKVYANVKDQE